MCLDIINSDIDVAMLWMIDSDPGRPIAESIGDSENFHQRAVLTAANTALGW